MRLNRREFIARWRTAEGEDARVRPGLSADAAAEAACAYLDPRSPLIPGGRGQGWRTIGAWLQRSWLVISTPRKPSA